jgi:transcriptional regulator with XRE-family HTH domain
MKKPSRTKSSRLAHKLRQIRISLNLSQSELLERLGFGDELFRSNISQYERGSRVPAPFVILRYARISGVSMEEIVDDQLNLPRKIANKRISERE